MSKPIKRVGDCYRLIQCQAYSRGGAMLKGQVRQQDLDASDAATTGGFDLASELNVFGAFVPVDAAGIAQGYPMAVAMQNIADDQVGLWTLEGAIDVAVMDDDATGTDVDAGLGVTVAAAAAYADAVGAAERIMGIALETGAASSDNAADQVDASSHLRRVLWFGGRPGGGWITAA